MKEKSLDKPDFLV